MILSCDGSNYSEILLIRVEATITITMLNHVNHVGVFCTQGCKVTGDVLTMR